MQFPHITTQSHLNLNNKKTQNRTTPAKNDPFIKFLLHFPHCRKKRTKQASTRERKPPRLNMLMAHRVLKFRNKRRDALFINGKSK